MSSFRNGMLVFSAPVLTAPGTALVLHVLPLLPAWIPSSSVAVALIDVFPLSGSVITRTTVETDQMSFVLQPVLLSSSAVLEEPVYPWSCAVMAILTAPISPMRSSVPQLQKSQDVCLGSSGVLTDAVYLPLKCVMEDWTVGLLMTQMSEVTKEVLRLFFKLFVIILLEASVLVLILTLKIYC